MPTIHKPIGCLTPLPPIGSRAMLCGEPGFQRQVAGAWGCVCRRPGVAAARRPWAGHTQSSPGIVATRKSPHGSFCSRSRSCPCATAAGLVQRRPNSLGQQRTQRVGRRTVNIPPSTAAAWLSTTSNRQGGRDPDHCGVWVLAVEAVCDRWAARVPASPVGVWV